MLFAKRRSLKIADVKDFPLYISKIEIYNPLSALLLTLVCHFYYVLLRVAIFVLNVAIATYFERRQKELSTKTLLWKIYRGKVVQFFYRTTLTNARGEYAIHTHTFWPFFRINTKNYWK